MKLIIAGGRDYAPQRKHWHRLKRLFQSQADQNDPVTEIVSGNANGADLFGELIGGYYDKRITLFPADWDKWGKAAGPIRNAEMAEYADAVVLLPGGNGTDNMAAQSSKNGLEIFDWR